jgi:hypothetical protein
MKHLNVIALLLMSNPALGLAQHKTKQHPDLAVDFRSARYVYVQAVDGDILKPGLYPADRQAISDVEVGMRDWNRYILTIRREQAELVFVVRKGRIAGAQGHGTISVGTRSQGSQTPSRDPGQTGDADAVGAAGEVGPGDDLLRVYTINADGKLSGPIWTQEIRNGLEAPAVLLLQQLKAAVERAYPRQPASKQPTP